MRLSWWLSGRLAAGSARGKLASPALFISVSSIAVSVCVMLISLAILKGFSREIENTISSFSGHLQLTSYQQNPSLEPDLFTVRKSFMDSLRSIKGISQVRPFLYKGALIKSENESEAVLVKGLTPEDFKVHYSRFLNKGKTHDLREDEVFLSASLAGKLSTEANKKVLFYFLETPSKLRKLRVAGVFYTGFGEFDQGLVLCHASVLQQLQKADKQMFAGLELSLTENTDENAVQMELQELMPVWMQSRTVREMNPQLFDWLSLQDTNVVVIGSIMVLVCILNMLTILLVQMLEHTHTQGVFQALGMQAAVSGRVFMFLTGRYALLGLLAGNMMGVGMIFLQQKFRWIALDPVSYYISFVPVHLDLVSFLGVNAGALFVCWFSVVLPLWLLRRGVQQNLLFR